MSIKEVYAAFRRCCFPSLEFYLRKLLVNCKSFVDLGCGPSSPLRFVKGRRSLGVDVAKESIKESKKKGIFSEYLVADVLKTKLPANAFDAAVSLDVLNLQKKRDGLKLLKEMERIAKKRVIVLMPNGKVEEPKEMRAEAESKYKAPYEYLKYRSVWTAKEMRKRGFRVIGINGLKWLRKGNAKPRVKPTFLGLLLSDLTQSIVRFFPSLAFHLLCYKDVE